MNRAVIAIADQVIVQELRSRLDQSEADVEVGFVAESTQELVSSVLAHRPSIAFVHDQLGPGPVMQIVRDLTLRNPALAVLVVTTSNTAEAFAGALNAGARGVLTHPFGLEDLDEEIAHRHPVDRVAGEGGTPVVLLVDLPELRDPRVRGITVHRQVVEADQPLQQPGGLAELTGEGRVVRHGGLL